ncbi:Protein N-acetyltransferase, RimJ/RimL family [Saccharopolyspora kobensis]|uniref:Protein N-acetyltransferase, RimJ/RimL family n=1 Tax=Saccharopolyspora kobensis TaxID=146035 RepID=A0A1H5U077_9PSEU|nr:GNAT family N-acetyltransferase [Saccharopolyspora kobensis]SEF68443.1 Protein N-acetyltransferase, RimJ/RimL family [Saccharopolyspora kobensis]SFC39940.1 Protein N-acetyltransferase, RimJ/RimL family [Saccharopolyspora kobensis]
MDAFLTTERLVLREFRADDVDLVLELNGDPDVMRYIFAGPPLTRSEVVEKMLPGYLSCYQKFGGLGRWAVLERATDRFVGLFILQPAEGRPSDEAELGYRFHRSAWGKGYATEGAIALLDKGFADFGLRRIFAQAMVVNPGSRRVMEKAGMRYVRTFFQADWPGDPIEGEEHGDVEYELTRDEWLAQKR